MLHVFYRTIALRNTLQTLFAKLMISSDFTVHLARFSCRTCMILIYIKVKTTSCYQILAEEEIRKIRQERLQLSIGLRINALDFVGVK